MTFTLVDFARFFKRSLQKLGLNQFIPTAQNFYNSVLLKDNGTNFVYKRLNGEVYKMVPRLAKAEDTYEIWVTQWLRQYLQPGDTYWDVGANYGLTILQAAPILGQNGKILAMEPSQANLEVLYRNIQLNDHQDITEVLEAAVCDSHGGTITLSLLNEGDSPSNSLMFSEIDKPLDPNIGIPKVSQEVSVPAISLDGLINEGRTPPSLIKIDVEGAELKVLEGATQLLDSEIKPTLILAVHPFWQETSDDCQTIVKILQNKGYQILNRQGLQVNELEYDEYLCVFPES
jgi:FkbM family methyltransferase